MVRCYSIDLLRYLRESLLRWSVLHSAALLGSLAAEIECPAIAVQILSNSKKLFHNIYLDGQRPFHNTF